MAFPIINILYIKYFSLNKIDENFNWYSFLIYYYFFSFFVSLCLNILIVFDGKYIIERGSTFCKLVSFLYLTINTLSLTISNIDLIILSFFLIIINLLFIELPYCFYYKNRLKIIIEDLVNN
jgi:hypothetical protein